MDHDVLAELDAYKRELAAAERAGNEDHAAAVRDEIARVGAAVRRRAALHTEAADGHHAAGQYELAAQARREASRYTDVLGADDASAQVPQETAVPAKRGPGRPPKEK